MMWCFLCDRPAKYQVEVLPNKERQKQVPAPLPVCVDCVRRVSEVAYDEDDREYIVRLRSLT